MATLPMYAAGGRRSAAPVIAAPQAQQAQVIQQLVQMMQAQAAPQTPQQAAPAAPQTQAQSNSRSGGNYNLAAGGAGTTDPRGFAKALSALQGAAMLAGERDATKAIGQLGTVANVGGAVASGDPMNVAKALGPTVAAKLGAPAGLFGVGMGLAEGNTAKAIDSGLNLFGPVGMTLSAINQIQSLFTGETLGSMLSPAAPAAAPASDSQTATDQDSFGGGYGVRGSGGNWGGGFGGGIGQSGGNAAGMGSNQA